jgi:hypothetical protein
MTNREIINFIDRYCAQKKDFDSPLNTDLAFTMLAHGYLYIRPGEDTEKFVSDVLDALKVGACKGIEMYRRYYFDSYSLDEWMRIYMAEEALNVAKEAFDETYFNTQASRLDPNEECNESLLDKYLKLMDKKQLLDFLHMCTHYSQDYLVFTNGNISVYLELHKCCRKKDSSLPQEWYEGRCLNDDDPYYVADYLSNEEIIDAIERDIVYNKSLAGHLARRLYTTGDIDYIDPYIHLISSYELATGRDIYNPQIYQECL